MGLAGLWGLCVAGLVGLALGDNPIVVYYYSQWSVWQRQFCANVLSDEDKFRGTTHVQYAFFAPDASCKMISKDKEADIGGVGWELPCEIECLGLLGYPENTVQGKDRGNIGCLRKMREKGGWKLGISLGGWTMSNDFSKCVKPDKRSTFVDSILANVADYDWDFVDFDWEYPQGGGNDGWNGHADDWEDLKATIDLLKSKSSVGVAAAVGMNPHLLLGTGDYVNPTPMKWLCDNLDYVTTMSYDLSGGWTDQTGWPAPLYHDPDAPYDDADKLNIDWQLRTWKEACGSNFHKVVLGLPAYGKSWRSVGKGAHGHGAYEKCMHTGGGLQPYASMPCLGDGSFMDSPGTLEVWDIETHYKPHLNCHHYFHDVAKQDFFHCSGDQILHGVPDVWFAYDGPEVFYEKVKLAKAMGVGGFMFWEAGYTMISLKGPKNTMHVKKNAAYKAAGSPKDVYHWKRYEDACFDAWQGKPMSPLTKSKGLRVIAGGEVENSAPNCDEVSAGSVGDVNESCVASFCTQACKTFVTGRCKDEVPQSVCVESSISHLPGATISCSFASA